MTMDAITTSTTVDINKGGIQTLPDSRLIDPKGSVMSNWDIRQADGSIKRVRLELVPIYCFNCGIPQGYVVWKADGDIVVSWASWLCESCSEKWGTEADKLFNPDHKFWEAVYQEMLARFGRGLSQDEIYKLGEQGLLGKKLELLAKESPYSYLNS